MEDNRTRKINDSFYIVDVGFRREQPVALVEKTFPNNSKEYIIAFDYSIKDDKIDWGYGYYYNENIEKAKEDFVRVLKGEDLADTFSDKEVSEDEFYLAFYSEDEIRNLIKSKAELYYVDDGIDEAIIKFEDIPDFIVEYEDGGREFIEVKGDNKVDDDIVQAKARAAKEVAKALRMKYRMVKSSEIMKELFDISVSHKLYKYSEVFILIGSIS